MGEYGHTLLQDCCYNSKMEYPVSGGNEDGVTGESGSDQDSRWPGLVASLKMLAT